VAWRRIDRPRGRRIDEPVRCTTTTRRRLRRDSELVREDYHRGSMLSDPTPQPQRLQRSDSRVGMTPSCPVGACTKRASARGWPCSPSMRADGSPQKKQRRSALTFTDDTFDSFFPKAPGMIGPPRDPRSALPAMIQESKALLEGISRPGGPSTGMEEVRATQLGRAIPADFVGYTSRSFAPCHDDFVIPSEPGEAD
jgi:hypothetical protein